MRDRIDYAIVEDINRFWNKAITGFDFRAGLRPDFPVNDPALRWDTEYFGPNVTMDDRLRYVGNYLSINPLISDPNRVLNVVVTHFYGGRDCHRVINAEMNPALAYTDFERMLVDDEYRADLRRNIDISRSLGYSIWSKTELHTSLMAAMNRFSREKYDEDKHPGNMLDWLAGWIEDGTVDRILECDTLEKCVGILTSKSGVGNYYGYHGATDQSTNPSLPFHHDEPFVLPGPGCQATLRVLFPNQKPTGEQVVWVRERADELFPDLNFHEHWWNIEVDGQKVYSFDQSHLTCYTTEVALCQYGIYREIRECPEKEAKRKIENPDIDSIVRDIMVRKNQPTLEEFF